MYAFQWPVRTYVGEGILNEIGTLVPPDKKEKRHRALITSAVDPWCHALNDRVKILLSKSGWKQIEVWPQIEANPSRHTVNQGISFCKEHQIDVIFAVGGGSTIDASKMIAMEAGVPHVIAIPTTAGTGSELNEYAVITNTDTSNKESNQTIFPQIALLDPELTLSLPPLTTLLTGIDAFCHCLESYVRKTTHPITDAMALAGMELSAKWLRQAVENGDDIEARKAIMESSMFGGAAMLGEGLGLMHGIGNVAGGFTHDAHGLLLTRLLDSVMTFNEPAIPSDKLIRCGEYIDCIRALALEKFEELNVPSVVFREEDLPALADRAFANYNSTTNPREFSREDIIAIARVSFQVA